MQFHSFANKTSGVNRQGDQWNGSVLLLFYFLFVEYVHEAIAELREIHGVYRHGPRLPKGIHGESSTAHTPAKGGAIDAAVLVVVGKHPNDAPIAMEVGDDGPPAIVRVQTGVHRHDHVRRSGADVEIGIQRRSAVRTADDADRHPIEIDPQ